MLRVVVAALSVAVIQGSKVEKTCNNYDNGVLWQLAAPYGIGQRLKPSAVGANLQAGFAVALRRNFARIIVTYPCAKPI